MSGPERAHEASEFRDRRRGLVVYGTIAIVLGALLGLIGAAGILAASIVPQDGPQPPDVRSLVLGVAVYFLLGIVLIWVGIGSIQARRWVRPIMLIVAWTWLLCGVFALAFWILILPDFQAAIGKAMPPGTDAPPEMVTVMASVMSVGFLLFSVVLPALFVLFYQSADVKATLERYDLAMRWTDRCPVPVLGLSLGLWYGAGASLAMLAFDTLPFFGLVLRGGAAVAVTLGLAGILALLGRETFRLTALGWWGSLALAVLTPLGGIVTLARTDVVDLYRAIGLQTEQLEALSQYRALGSPILMVLTGVLGAGFVVYTFSLRKYFVNPQRGPGG